MMYYTYFYLLCIYCVFCIVLPWLRPLRYLRLKNIGTWMANARLYPRYLTAVYINATVPLVSQR